MTIKIGIRPFNMGVFVSIANHQSNSHECTKGIPYRVMVTISVRGAISWCVCIMCMHFCVCTCMADRIGGCPYVTYNGLCVYDYGDTLVPLMIHC